MKNTNLSQHLIFENKKVDISYEMDQFNSASGGLSLSASGVWKYNLDISWEMEQFKSASGV